MTSWIVTIPDSLKTQEVCDEEVKDDHSFLQFVPDHFKTQEMCKKVELNPWHLKHVPDHFKKQEMCNDVVRNNPYTLEYVPDVSS